MVWQEQYWDTNWQATAGIPHIVYLVRSENPDERAGKDSIENGHLLECQNDHSQISSGQVTKNSKPKLRQKFAQRLRPYRSKIVIKLYHKTLFFGLR